MDGELVDDSLSQWHDLKESYDEDIQIGNKTPFEAGSFLQRYFVTVHPFHDGNGRVSRFILDLISKKFNMPYAPAGDLTNDILSTKQRYFKETLIKTDNMMELLKQCYKYHKEGGSNEMAYRCRELPQVKLDPVENCINNKSNRIEQNYSSDQDLVDGLKADLSLSVKEIEHEVYTYSWGQSSRRSTENLVLSKMSYFWKKDPNADGNLGSGLYASHDPRGSSSYAGSRPRLIEIRIPKGTIFLDTRGGPNDPNAHNNDTFDISLELIAKLEERCGVSIESRVAPFKVKDGREFGSFNKQSLVSGKDDRCRKIFNQALKDLNVEFIAYKWGNSNALLSGCHSESTIHTAFIFLGKPVDINGDRMSMGNIKAHSYWINANDKEIQSNLDGYEWIDKASKITAGTLSQWAYFKDIKISTQDRQLFKNRKFNCSSGQYLNDAPVEL